MENVFVHTLDDGGWAIFCPACQCGHKFDNIRWTFNGNFEKPTFKPSYKDANCHLVLTDGIINFQLDCSHSMAGKSVPIEPF